jgi:hypothetical protein
VPMTHHQAVADGYDLLDEMASFANSLGEVTWTDMKTISRSLYSRRQDDKTLLVRMLSKRVSVPVLEGTTRIHVERPWLEDSAEETLFWRTIAEDRSWKVALRPATFTVQAGLTIELASGPAATTQTESHDTGPLRLAPVARRVLTEGRDRVLPSIHRIVSRGRSSRRP